MQKQVQKTLNFSFGWYCQVLNTPCAFVIFAYKYGFVQGSGSSQEFRSSHKVILINLVSSVPCPGMGYVPSSPSGQVVGTRSQTQWVHFLFLLSFSFYGSSLASLFLFYHSPSTSPYPTYFYAFSSLHFDLDFFFFSVKHHSVIY